MADKLVVFKVDFYHDPDGSGTTSRSIHSAFYSKLPENCQSFLSHKCIQWYLNKNNLYLELTKSKHATLARMLFENVKLKSNYIK